MPGGYEYKEYGSGVLQMPYGDQAQFMKADRFHAAGDFPDVPIMDDFALVRQLRRLGSSFSPSPSPPRRGVGTR